jgi:hypothetical protein
MGGPSKNITNIFSEDDTFAKLRNMSFDEALDLAIELNSDLPLGSSEADRLEKTEWELKRFGWSYAKLQDHAKARNNT